MTENVDLIKNKEVFNSTQIENVKYIFLFQEIIKNITKDIGVSSAEDENVYEMVDKMFNGNSENESELTELSEGETTPKIKKRIFETPKKGRKNKREKNVTPVLSQVRTRNQMRFAESLVSFGENSKEDENSINTPSLSLSKRKRKFQEKTPLLSAPKKNRLANTETVDSDFETTPVKSKAKTFVTPKQKEKRFLLFLLIIRTPISPPPSTFISRKSVVSADNDKPNVGKSLVFGAMYLFGHHMTKGIREELESKSWFENLLTAETPKDFADCLVSLKNTEKLKFDSVEEVDFTLMKLADLNLTMIDVVNSLVDFEECVSSSCVVKKWNDCRIQWAQELLRSVDEV